MTLEGLQFSDPGAWALHVGRLRLDLYRVVAAILSSEGYDLQQLNAGKPAWPSKVTFPPGDPLGRLAADFQDGEIEHGLVTVAALTRVLLDQLSPRPPEARAVCGTFSKAPATQAVDLSLREACNKVLHATTRSFVWVRDEPGVLPKMRLNGTLLGKQWVADLDVLVFAAYVAGLTERRQPTASTPP